MELLHLGGGTLGSAMDLSFCQGKFSPGSIHTHFKINPV